MRDIKFRAWYPETGTMLLNPCISDKGKVMYLEGGWDYMDDVDSAIVMQYTGLKDIYEDDVCKTIEGLSKIVYYNYGFWLEGITWKGMILLSDRNVEVKQIGNIYETPELLND